MVWIPVSEAGAVGGCGAEQGMGSDTFSQDPSGCCVLNEQWGSWETSSKKVSTVIQVT